VRIGAKRPFAICRRIVIGRTPAILATSDILKAIRPPSVAPELSAGAPCALLLFRFISTRISADCGFSLIYAANTPSGKC